MSLTLSGTCFMSCTLHVQIHRRKGGREGKRREGREKGEREGRGCLGYEYIHMYMYVCMCVLGISIMNKHYVRASCGHVYVCCIMYTCVGYENCVYSPQYSYLHVYIYYSVVEHLQQSARGT